MVKTRSFAYTRFSGSISKLDFTLTNLIELRSQSVVVSNELVLSDHSHLKLLVPIDLSSLPTNPVLSKNWFAIIQIYIIINLL